MPGPFKIKRGKETVVLIGIIGKQDDRRSVSEHIRELAFLVDTAGGIPVKTFQQSMDHPDPRTFVGSGKLEEIRQYVNENAVDIAVFDDELSPSQLRNIERVLECKVLDRNNLILDIFAIRARTAHAKT
ncbi:MAG: GTPase HflX, partial [Bacteroidales bacterium]|nr:GTPase HflX [Bacteroidales bacterium]